jgi:hypothetical protein
MPSAQGWRLDLRRRAGLLGRVIDHPVLRAAGAVDVAHTREVHGISAARYSVFTLGVALWLAYGFRPGEWPIIIANAVTLVLAATILVTKLVVQWRSRGMPRQVPA